MSLSIDSFDIISPCNLPGEFEYVDPRTGKGTGVVLSVVGAHSDAVKTWVRKSINAARVRNAAATASGREVVRTFEEDEADSIESAAVRVVDWKGITEPFSRENAVRLCTINPDIKREIIAFSDNLANFINSK
jgi:hypothetical protein